MTKSKILITRKIPGLKTWQAEHGEYELHVHEEERNMTRGELSEKAKEVEAIISMLGDPIDKDFLKENDHLKVVTNYAVGYNNIDTDEAQRLGIAVGNTPDVLTHTTAETAITLLLMVARQVAPAIKDVKKGLWTSWEPELYNGYDLRDRTLGIIGFGRIGQDFAKKAYALWKCPILVWERESAKDLDLDFPYQVVSPEEFKKRVDVISLHCPLNDESQELIKKEFIDEMANPFLFINTARGGCHVEHDLFKGLEEGKIQGVGLDVTDPEPMSKNSPILGHAHTIVFPHIGSATIKTRTEMTTMCFDNVVAALKERPLPFPVVDPYKKP